MKARQTETLLAYLLRYGVLMSAAVIGFGVFLLFFSTKGGFSGLESVLAGNFSSTLTPALTLATFQSGLKHLDPFAVSALGLLLLILLPIGRVAFTVVLFFFEKDYLYFFVTAFVLTVLVSSLFFGKSL